MDELVAATKNESGTLIYEWYFNDENTVCNIYERFADSEAAMTHLGSFGNFADRFLTTVTPTRLTVFGNPDAAVKEILAGFSPVYLRFEAGFAR